MLQNKGKLSELFMTLCFNDKKNADSILSVVIKELGKIQDYYQYLEQKKNHLILLILLLLQVFIFW